MSLDDVFYPQDKSPITKLDNSLIKFSGKIGEAYQHLTGKSYKKLVEKCYKATSIGCGAATLGMHVSAPLIAYVAHRQRKETQYMSPAEEEIKCELSGTPKQTRKLTRLVFLAISPALVLLNYCIIKDGVGENTVFENMFAFGGVLQGVSMIPFNFAEYLTKANIPPPPKKTAWEKAKDKLNELTTVRTPQPIYVRSYEDNS